MSRPFAQLVRRGHAGPDADGSWEEIQDVVEGDLLAIDQISGLPSIRPIVDVVAREGTRHIIGIDVDAGDGTYVEVRARPGRLRPGAGRLPAHGPAGATPSVDHRDLAGRG